jgi:hypothetical protein
MKSLRRIVSWTCLGAGTLLALCGSAEAQYTLDGLVPGGSSPRSQWEQRVLRTARAPSQASAQAALTDDRFFPQPSTRLAPPGGPGMPRRPMAPGQADAVLLGSTEGLALEPTQSVEPDPMASEDGGVAGGYGSPASGCGVCGGSGYPGDGGSCGECGDDCGGGAYQCLPGRGILSGWWFRDLSLFAGVHGFKGPLDQGLNGNFGFQEGVNLGAPLGGCNIGYQLGFAANQSNFSGDQTRTAYTGIDQSITDGTGRDANVLTPSRGDRHQYFFTGGIFQRALCGGIQWGVVFDFMRDMYYDQADLKQIRSETSFVFPGGCNEIGYFGAYNVGGDRLRLEDRIRILQTEVRFNSEVLLAPTDMFVGFFRRHFETGGEGRIWGGFSGHGNGLVGADLRVPLGGSWAVENSFTYLVPKHGRGTDGLREEAWGLNIQLVWYPGRRAACVQNDCYRPLFGVADNSTFLVHTRQVQTTATPTPPTEQPPAPE